MDDLIDKKIEEAQTILKALELPESQQNRVCALTLLALGNLKPSMEWKQAKRESMTLSKDIMEFVNSNYKADYKANSRESFRKLALRPFIEYNLVLLNPDNPTLTPHSSKTHYALSDLALETIQKFNSNEWEAAIENFKVNQYPENTPSSITLRTIVIRNFKSVLEDEINLGRFNVFIGANGSGKSNIIEAIAAVGASKAGDMNLESLYSRGVRIARPDLMVSSFLQVSKKENIEFELSFENAGKFETISSSLYPENPNDIYTRWSDQMYSSSLSPSDMKAAFQRIMQELIEDSTEVASRGQLLGILSKRMGVNKDINDVVYNELLSEYAIFDLNTKSLRGTTPVDSRKTPLGINGEGLDLLIANFNAFEKDFLDSISQDLFDWLEKVQSQKDEKLNAEGLKAGRSTSTLYFKDKYMQKKNNVLSAENSNEGILHVLFYVALFISTKTPTLFAIDNIETALNPKLCRKLVTILAQLAKERGKQVLITTHNPAILDGLNLHDDEQRLFEVKRDSEGRTKTRRIQFKPEAEKKFKLSELWMKGLIGGIPQNF